MKKSALSAGFAAALLSLSMITQQSPAAVVLDPDLRIVIEHSNPHVVLTWFASNAVPYQVESSIDFAWTNSSSVITGAGGFFFFTNSALGQHHRFFRVKRFLPAPPVTAVFNAASGILIVTGDESDNAISVGRDVVGTILVNGGAVPIEGSAATVTNTVLVEIFGRAGGDQLTIDQSGGVMPVAHLFGEDGDDTLTGGSTVDQLAGGPGADALFGRGGNDLLDGGPGDDTFIWNPGDGSDTIEGQAGTDVMVFNGSAGAEIMEAAANGARLRFTRNLGNIVMDVDGVERLDCHLFGSTDNFIVNKLDGTAVTQIDIDLGAVGGGSDGQADIVTLNSTAAVDMFNFAANAGVVEASGLGALVRVSGGALSNDVISITGVSNDVVNINGSAGGDVVTVTANLSNAHVNATGFTTPVSVRGSLTLAINGLGGMDNISCVGNLAAIVPLVLDGGDDNDTILGSNGADILIGGAGDDFIDGQQGNDFVFGGTDHDTFQWDPGDGSDTLEGQEGTDIMLFNGSAGAEIMEAMANGARLRFTRNLGNIVMDVNGVERVDCNLLGSTDAFTVNSLAGTDVTQLNLNLAGTLGGSSGDAQMDTITINGTAAGDAFDISAISAAVNVTGMTPAVRITNSETANDRLIVNGLGGTDLFNIGAGVSSLISVTTNQ